MTEAGKAPAEDAAYGGALIPERLCGNTDTGLLKWIALATMVVDHVGALFFPDVPGLRIIGRIALPLYAWCLVVGCSRTRSMPRYILRLFICAVISQPLYALALGHPLTHLGIMFQLTNAALAVWGIRANRCGSRFWAPALVLAGTCFLDIDYGWQCIAFILLLYLARKDRRALILAYIAWALYWGSMYVMYSDFFGIKLQFLYWPYLKTIIQPFFRLQALIWLALPLIVCKTHSQVRMPKWLGYSLYPLHLVLLTVINVMAGTPFSEMVRTMLAVK